MPDFSNPIFSGASVDEQAVTGTSLEDSWSDYATKGIPSAVVSGAIGLANTGVALANSLGASITPWNESESIRQDLGADAQDFYQRHQTGVDFTGLLLGSFAPGALASKAIRAAGIAGRLTEGLSAATGLESVPLGLGGDSVKTATEAVLSQQVPSLMNPAVYRAIAQGAVNQVVEGIGVTAAVLATNNQNSTLNPDHLGYWNALGSEAIESIPGVFEFAGLGTVLEGIGTRGIIKQAVREEQNRTVNSFGTTINDLRSPLNDVNLNFQNPGDNMVQLMAKKQDYATNPVYAVNAADLRGTTAYQVGTTILDDTIQKQFGLINSAGTYGEDFLNDHLMTMEQGQLQSTISGLSNVALPKVSDFNAMDGFFRKTIAPFKIVDASTPEDFAAQLKAELMSHPELKLDEGQIDTIIGTAVQDVKDRPDNFGHTYNQAEVASLQQQLGTKVMKQLPQFKLFGNDQYIPAGLVYTNNKAMESYFPAWAKEQQITFPGYTPTVKDFQEYVLTHELGHLKTNSADNLALVSQAFQNKSTVAKELVNLSMALRPSAWEEIMKNLGNKQRLFGWSIEEQMAKMHSLPQDKVPYALKSVELMADACGALVHPNLQIAERAARIAPEASKLLNKFGALRQPFNPRTAYYNIYSKSASTSTVLNPWDIGSVNTAKNGTISVQSTKYAYPAKRDFFSNENLLPKGAKKVDPFEAAARWASAAKTNPIDFEVAKDGTYVVRTDNLPMMEKYVTTQFGKDAKFGLYGPDKLADNYSPVTKADIATELQRKKSELLLQLQGTEKYNEQHIAQILNISQDRALGHSFGEWNMMASRDYSRPENFKLSYGATGVGDADISARSAAASNARMEINDAIQQSAAAQVMGKDFGKYTEAPGPQKMSQISEMDTRSGVISPLRTDFNSFREWASYIGTVTNDILNKIKKGLDNGFIKYYSHFDQVGNVADRMELALVDNMARRELMVLVKDGETGDRYLLAKSLRDNVQLEEGEDPNAAMVKAAQQEIANKSNRAAKLGKAVGDFVEDHVNKSAQIWDKQKVVAIARNSYVARDNDVFYPPTPDLKTTPFHAFVVPKKIIAESEPQKYMIYARDSRELAEKIAYVRNNYGDTHDVFTGGKEGQIANYKRMIGEYDAGQVYDQMHFDSSLARVGTSQDFTPNLNIRSAQVLDRYLKWQQDQNVMLHRAAVELRYGKVMTYLDSMDGYYGGMQQSKIFGGETPRDTIWRNTRNMMLDQRGNAGPVEGLWKSVNDAVGTRGSMLIDNIIKTATSPIDRGIKLTQQDFAKMNEELAARGFNPPFQNVMDAIAASPYTRTSTTLPLLVRTMNNFVSTFMLSLDQANTVMMTLSTPILLSPLIKEMRMAFPANSAEMKQLDNLTSVINPATKLREPSSAAIMGNAVKSYWTPEGKAFLQELYDRGIIKSKFFQEYNDAMDFSSLTGNHTLRTLNDKVEQLADFGSKYWSRQQFGETFLRYVAGHSAAQLADLRGLGEAERWSVIAGMVDKIHGIYRYSQRPGVFGGVIGQAVGLYQTYIFNFLQNAMKFVEGGNNKLALQMMALQASIHGLRSMPGFNMLNKAVANTNQDKQDLYNLSGADDPKTPAAYLMYGAASHMFGIPMDLFSRGDHLNVRNTFVLPTDISDVTGISSIARAVGNVVRTGQLMAQPGVPVGSALLFGLAHNGLNRPLQGLATVAMNQVTSNKGAVYFQNSNYDNYNNANNLNVTSMFARVIGTKPLDESILMDNYYRRMQYQASARQEQDLMTEGLRLKIGLGAPLSQQDYDNFSQQYERNGGTPEGFNSFWVRQLANADQSAVLSFRDSLTEKTAAARSYRRMQLDRNPTQPWNYPSSEGAGQVTSVSDPQTSAQQIGQPGLQQ